MCGHTKVIKDVRLTASVPAIKKTMEQLLFQVKAMLDANNCLSAFSIGKVRTILLAFHAYCSLGNLKHRALTGEEISSQIPLDEMSDEENAEAVAIDLMNSSDSESSSSSLGSEHSLKRSRSP
jgi:fanconi anemia group D2 protein